MLTCTKCKEQKEEEAFYRKKDRKTGRDVYCKPCSNSFRTKKVASDANKRYYRANKGKCHAKSALYRARKLHATPDWLTASMKAEMENIYRLAKELSCPVDVDHIIPLQGKNVCGLHVPGNLQLLSPTTNRQKSNKGI